MFEVTHAAVPLEALNGLAAARMPARSGSVGAEAHGSHSSQFDSEALACEGRYSAAKLRALLAHMPAGVLRAKGIVRTDEADASVLQFSGRHGSLRAIESALATDMGHVVAIGLHGQLPAQALRGALAAARLPA